MYDSGLFLKAGSLRSIDSIRVSALGGAAADTTSPYAVRGCMLAAFRLERAAAAPIPLTISYQLSGTAVAGVDYAPLSGTATIPASATFVEVPVTALAGGSGLRELTLSPLTAASPYATLPAYGQSASLQIRDRAWAAIVTFDTVICVGCQAQVVVQGDTALQYQWTPATGLSNPNIAMPLATPPQSTLYHMQATYANCPPAQDSLMIWVGDVDIEEPTALSGISVYPNPFSNYFQLQAEPGYQKLEVQLYDATGKLLLKQSGNLAELNRALRQTGTLAAGNYLLEVSTDDKKPLVFKLSKQE